MKKRDLFLAMLAAVLTVGLMAGAPLVSADEGHSDCDKTDSAMKADSDCHDAESASAKGMTCPATGATSGDCGTTYYQAAMAVLNGEVCPATGASEGECSDETVQAVTAALNAETCPHSGKMIGVENEEVALSVQYAKARHAEMAGKAGCEGEKSSDCAGSDCGGKKDKADKGSI